MKTIKLIRGFFNQALQNAILVARRRLDDVIAKDDILETCAEICIAMGSDGLRGELTLLKTARSLAAYEGTTQVTKHHVKRIAPMALAHRLRRDPLDDTGSVARIERTLDAVMG